MAELSQEFLKKHGVVSEEEAASTTISPDFYKKFGIVSEVEAGPASFSTGIERLGKSALGSAIEMSPTVAGAMKGFQYGAPAGPWGRLAGLVLGGGAGYIAGSTAREKLGEVTPLVGERPEQVPESERPWAYAGEIGGGAFPFSAAPFAMAARNVTFDIAYPGAKWLNTIIRSAKETPKSMAALEAGAATGSAIASGLAERGAPGRPEIRIPAEIAGGFFNPTSWAIRGGQLARGAIRQGMESVSKDAQSNAAVRILQNMVEKSGDDPELLVQALRSESLPGVAMTSGMLSGNPALQGLETALARGSGQFSAARQEMVESSMIALREMADKMAATGRPEMLTEAARLRQLYFEHMLNGRLAQASDKVQQAAAKISPDNPRDMAALSQTAHVETRKALTDMRAIEKTLWQSKEIDKGMKVGVNNMADKFDELVSDLLPDMKMPKEIEGFMERLTKGSAFPRTSEKMIIEGLPGSAYFRMQTTLGQLIAFRSNALELGREAVAAGKFGDARRFREMGQAALDDMGEIAVEGTPLYTARTYSNTLHDVMTRTFAGDVLAKGKTGAYDVSPELLLEKAFGAGGTQSWLRMAQLRGAAEGGAEARAALPEAPAYKGIPEPKLPAVSMPEAQERFIRLMADKVVDPQAGRVDPAKLETFLRNNQNLLDDFPKIRADLESAGGTEKLLRRMIDVQKQGRTIANRRAAFGRILEVDDPSLAIAQAVTSSKPVTRLDAMAKLAKNDGPEALSGFTSSALRYASGKATTKDGFSFVRYQHTLEAPLHPGGPSLIDVMLKNGAMTKSEVSQFKRIVEEASKIEGALRSGVNLDEIVGAPGMIMDYVLKVSGANIGGIFAFSAASPLIAAAAGSTLMRKIFAKVPRMKALEVLEEAAKNPKMMADMLEREMPKAGWEQVKLARRMHGYLWNAGLMELPEITPQAETNVPVEAAP